LISNASIAEEQMIGRSARRACATLLLLCLPASVIAQFDTSSPDPEGAGFSTKRLARIAPWYQAEVDAGALPGAVVAIARNGKLAYLQAIGTYDRARKIPLTPDAIFWIASMTKPVTSVAAMMLVEEGKLDLMAPVAKYLPVFKDKPVWVEDIDPATGKHTLLLEPEKRPMQVIDLLRHTSGLVYPEEGNTALHMMYHSADFRRNGTLADFVASLAALPLAHQPGEVWEYSWGVDVLARVIEVVSGQSFDQFLDSRIFKPLRMVDTGFYVPDEKRARLVDPIAGRRPALWDVTQPPKLFSGGGGLVSTASDYLRFCQMLLNGGELDGVRILSAKTVHQMTTNALPPDVRFAGDNGQFVGPRVGTGWDLGFAIRTNPDFSLLPGTVGSFSWSGVWGTYFWIDPVEKLIGVQMIQVPPDAVVPYRDALRHLTYAALSVPRPDRLPAPITLSAAALDTYVGTYDFGASLSSRDMQAPIPALAFDGVGLDLTLAENKVTVRRPTEGGPASKAGVKAGDVLAEIDDVPSVGLRMDQVVEMLRGRAGTQVRLKVVRKDQDPFDVTIVREPIRPLVARIEVRVEDGALAIVAKGKWAVLDFENGKTVLARPTSNSEFLVDGDDHTRLAFVSDQSGEVSGVVLNPGPWQITAAKEN
jgi:CubicO group peptidase (beta-lactamase class C family)